MVGAILAQVDAEIISVGTELVVGQTMDTNAGWLARRLLALGIPVRRQVTVPDDVAAIRDAIREATAGAQIVIVTGGLGPTPDDLSRDGLAEAVEQPLVSDPVSLDQIRRFFDRLGRSMPVSNERQALLPSGATALDNSCGTAPGIRAEYHQSVVFILPGVPCEMKTMFEGSVEPEIQAKTGGEAIITRTMHCFGAAEARIAEIIDDLMAPGRQPVVGITAAEAVISIRVMARGRDPGEAEATAEVDATTIRQRLGILVFGQADETLESVVGSLLRQQGATVATAESCTGGLLAKRFTDVPGSSAYFLGGTVPYSDALKTAILGVPRDRIEATGAVSAEIAASMADRCRSLTGATYALATTGIAGPSGGTTEKPVGLVYIGLADARRSRVRRFLVGDHLSRLSVRDRTCDVALNVLRLQLLGEDPLGETEPAPGTGGR